MLRILNGFNGMAVPTGHGQAVDHLPLLLSVLGVLGAAWWAWDYQHRILHLIRPHAIAPTRHPELVRTGSKGRPSLGRIEDTRPGAGSSVLGWVQFEVVAVLQLDETVIVGCHPQDEGLPQDDQSLVLLVGTDERSSRAVALLEQWRAARTRLRLRPTDKAGCIELYDGRRAALRARLLAA